MTSKKDIERARAAYSLKVPQYPATPPREISVGSKVAAHAEAAGKLHEKSQATARKYGLL